MTLLLVTSAVKAVAGIDFSAFSLPEAEPSSTTVQIAEQAGRMQKNALCETVQSGLNRALSERKVPCQVVKTDLHITDSGSITIDRVSVKGNLLTGTVYLREWLGPDAEIVKEDAHAD